MPRQIKHYVLFKAREIRDTTPHNGEEFLDLEKAVAWGFRVQNACDQAVVVQLTDGPGGGLIGASVSIAANTTEPIATDIWMPAMGVQVNYAVAPTSGALTLLGWVQEER